MDCWGPIVGFLLEVQRGHQKFTGKRVGLGHRRQGLTYVFYLHPFPSFVPRAYWTSNKSLNVLCCFLQGIVDDEILALAREGERKEKEEEEGGRRRKREKKGEFAIWKEHLLCSRTWVPEGVSDSSRDWMKFRFPSALMPCNCTPPPWRSLGLADALQVIFPATLSESTLPCAWSLVKMREWG